MQETGSSSETQLHSKTLEAEQLVNLWLAANGATIESQTASIRWGGESFMAEEIADFIWRESQTLGLRLIVATLKMAIVTHRRQVVASIKDRLLAEPDNEFEQRAKRAQGLGELDKFCRLMAHESCDNERLKYYKIALRQLVWQVKRRIAGKRTYWDLMIVFQSKQGSGKSTAVDYFARPLGEFYLEDADFGLFKDKFRINVFKKYYLVRFDEMDRANKASLQQVKRVITSKTLQARGMRSEGERSIERNASFVGTSNRPINHDLQDDSGMRRFVEFKCRDSKFNNEFKQALQGINFEALWNCESADTEEAPYSTAQELMESHQEELVTVSDFESWVHDYVNEGDSETLVSNMAAYRHFVDYVEIQKHRPVSIQVFAGLMREQFPKTRRLHKGSVVYRGLTLSNIE